MAVRRVNVKISGEVQGVFFRQSTIQRARRLGVSGWVRNLPDGRLEAEFQGPEAAVSRMVEFAGNGPPAAIVEGMETQDVPAVEGDEDFRVR